MASAGTKAGLLAAVAVASAVSTATFVQMSADGGSDGVQKQTTTTVLARTPSAGTKGGTGGEVTPTSSSESGATGGGNGNTGGSTTTNQDPLSDGFPSSTSNNGGNYYSNFKAETWGCTKKLFPGIESQVDHNWTQYHYFNSIERKSAYGWQPAANTVYNLNGATDSRLAQTKQEQTIGCALVKLKPIGAYTGHNRDFYLQSEIVIKNDQVGLILWTNWATNNGQTFSAMTYRMMLLFNEKNGGNDQWKLKGGLWWNDNNDLYYYTKHKDYYIKMPGENTHWYSTHDINSTVSSEKTWSAIWKPKSGSGGKQIYEDILISSGGKTKSELLGRAGSPFEKCTDTKRWCGWYYGGYFYETQESYTQRTKGWWGFARYTDISKTLQSWYKAFKDIKGEWTNSATACNNANGGSSSGTSSAPLQKLCQTSTSQSSSS